LNLLSLFSFSATSAQDVFTIHHRIEASRLASADINYIADPRVTTVPVSSMLSKEYARTRAALINPERANCGIKPGELAMAPGDTTSLAVVDREGNVISLIQSLATGMSGVVPDGTGFILQNRGLYFSLDDKQPNALAPRKRPSHTLIPALMENGDQHIAFAFVGGPTQVMAQMQFISNIADFKMNIQAALEAPRFTTARTRLNQSDCPISVESRMPRELLEGLTKKGHNIQTRAEYYSEMGVGQAVLWDSRLKVGYGASDPRGDGAAIPEPPRWK
jgi:gamma-glutamyltranspeptidase/glutathione hydrolase